MDVWQDLIPIQDLEENDATPVSIKNTLLAVYDGTQGITVSEARCPHAGANLCDGYFDGRNIECPLHQGLYDAITGVAKAAPATKPLIMFESRVIEGMVQVKLQTGPLE